MNFSDRGLKYQGQGTRDHNLGCTKRVLLVTWNFPPKKGGMENLNYDIFIHLSNGNDVFVIAPHARKAIMDPRVFRAPIKGIIPFFFYALIKGMLLCARLDFNVILGGSLIVTPILYILRFFVPCVTAYAHGLDIIYANRIYQLFVRAATMRMNGIICNSRHTLSLLRDRFGYQAITCVIPPGISIDKYRGRHGEIFKGAAHDRRFILSIGRLTDRKGLIEFLENCFTRLATEFPDLDFIIAGDDPVEAVYHGVGYRDRLTRATERLGLTDRVHLLGWVDEDKKKQLLATCECFVFPVLPARFDVEGFGIVAIEAAASGRPTIAFNSGGVGDAVIEGRTGALLAPGDYDGMLDVIHSVLENRMKYNCELSEIRKQFDWEFLARKYHVFFTQCCQKFNNA
ncbi:MAG: glycosyltransferase family 4 protein [Deltaproteobacteria bacterium]|nr:glycosyltransferase family 4 protein [Deltaproteobacteria bacterium]